VRLGQFVQRFGSLNLHGHFHVPLLDGVFARDARGRLVFHPAPQLMATDIDAIVARTARRSLAGLRKRGCLDDALQGDAQGDADERPDKVALAVERDGFNLHACVRIEAGDDMGRERLARYAARPPLSLERLRQLPGGRVSYRLKYVDRGRRGKHRVMTNMEFMARLAAIIAPPRYPLLRYGGVLAPRSALGRQVVPKPCERAHDCADERRNTPTAVAVRNGNARPNSGHPSDTRAPRDALPSRGNVELASVTALAPISAAPPVRPGEVAHKCHGRLRVLAVITEREPARRILAHLGLPSDAPRIAKARDPTDDFEDAETPEQLALGLP
jgi:hypothetical protein